MKLNLTDLLDRREVSEQLRDRVVMVTGGGGSIGSELCRHIIQMNPAKLLILDHSELNLYNIDCELRELKHPIAIEPILVDIKDLKNTQKIFEKFRPDFVYHAAAYKHVHLVESNPYTSIINNILGTKNLIDCSLLFEVKTFVLVSTDKAVNPTSIMGASKRVCELLTVEAAHKSGKRYCSVRFGNVLGSSGSLIPLLVKQVLAAGPVTITHPDMKRYFMLISEAVKLILKAGQISLPGDVNILQMGDAIEVVEMAKRVIALLGKTEIEIPIVFTQMRPGEKLSEELYLTGDETPTEHHGIVVLRNSGLDFKSGTIGSLLNYAGDEDDRALELLKELTSRDSKAYRSFFSATALESMSTVSF
jgi:FlaA1/EpsC-like NDP-sugar epimerase